MITIREFNLTEGSKGKEARGGGAQKLSEKQQRKQAQSGWLFLGNGRNLIVESSAGFPPDSRRNVAWAETRNADKQNQALGICSPWRAKGALHKRPALSQAALPVWTFKPRCHVHQQPMCTMCDQSTALTPQRVIGPLASLCCFPVTFLDSKLGFVIREASLNPSSDAE